MPIGHVRPSLAYLDMCESTDRPSDTTAGLSFVRFRTEGRRKSFMKKVLEGLFAIALLCVVAHAATVNTTLTITGTGISTSSTIGATGTTSFSGGLTGSGTFISSFSLTDPNVLQGKIPVSLTVTTGTTTGTLTGTLTAS